MPPRPDTNWTSLDAAAKALGISPDATRKRLERGTLKGEKRSGRWFVDPDGLGSSPDNQDMSLSGQTDATWTPPDAGPDSLRELVDHLKEENEFLRGQLDQRSRELADERERSDVLHREAFARIEAITAGLVEHNIDDQAAPESPQTRDVGSGATQAEQPSEGSNDAPAEPHRTSFSRWWAWISGR